LTPPVKSTAGMKSALACPMPPSSRATAASIRLARFICSSPFVVVRYTMPCTNRWTQLGCYLLAASPTVAEQAERTKTEKGESGRFGDGGGGGGKAALGQRDDFREAVGLWHFKYTLYITWLGDAVDRSTRVVDQGRRGQKEFESGQPARARPRIDLISAADGRVRRLALDYLEGQRIGRADHEVNGGGDPSRYIDGHGAAKRGPLNQFATDV